MKVLKERSRTYKGQTYYKYKVNIPENSLRAAQLKAGDELDVKYQMETLILKKRSDSGAK